MEKFSFFHDEGETKIDEDDQFHSWESTEDDIEAPKIDSHAADHTSITKVTIFAQSAARGNLLEIEEEDSNDGENSKSKRVNYLDGKAIEQLNRLNNNGSLPSKAGKPFDAKSATSKKTSAIGKLKIRAKVHLNMTNDAVINIEQVPLKETSRPSSTKEVTYKDSKGKVSVKQWNAKELEVEEDDEKILKMRDMLQKRDKARHKAQVQEELKVQAEELKRKQAESKIDMNKITFDTEGNILPKNQFNINKLPQVGKKVNPKFYKSSDSLVKSSFNDFKKRLKQQRDERDMIRGLKIKGSEKSESAQKQRKSIYKDLENLEVLDETGDKHAAGAVESGGSFFNSFKPKSGVTMMEGYSKVKKGNSYKSEVGNISRIDYSKTYSNRPFELKGVLSNSQSVGNLGASKKNQGISFYEEGSLPPIMSPRDRYNAAQDEDTTQEFVLDQSEIPAKKHEDTIIKQGDITDLINLSPRDILNDTNSNTNSQNLSQMSILPKYISKKSRNKSMFKQLSLPGLKKSSTINPAISHIISPRDNREDSPSQTISNFNKQILASMNWGQDSGDIRPVKIPRRPSESKKNMNYVPFSARNHLQIIQDQEKLKKNKWLNTGNMKTKEYLSQFIN